jgi:hypothetical protein
VDDWHASTIRIGRQADNGVVPRVARLYWIGPASKVLR